MEERQVNIMLTSTVDTLQYERAKRAREIEYLKEIAKDDVIDNRTMAAESTLIRETTEDLLEANDLLLRISPEDTITESAEIERILKAEGDITFEEMTNLSARAKMLN